MSEPLLLVQFLDDDGVRRAGRVIDQGAAVQILDAPDGVRGLAAEAWSGARPMSEVITHRAQDSRLVYARLQSEGRLLCPIDHPDPAHLLLSGTGLTHRASASGRNAMHTAASSGTETDSMRMYRRGEEAGKPEPGRLGAQPEWFYKGDGDALVHPGGALEWPAFAEDGGEEAELAGIYLVAPDGTPTRIGFTLANEYSDHRMERRNYLDLAQSKLRQASIGPEIMVGELPSSLSGRVRVLRGEQVVWESAFATGEDHMCHSIANLEHHHFKHARFRRPGDVHVHFMGAAAGSFSANIETRDGDCFEITAKPFVLPLFNRLQKIDDSGYIHVHTL
jgi:hypothetical protein